MTVRSRDKVVERPMDQVEPAVREALAEERFGVLTEIDVAATRKAKLGVDSPALKILGACNPALSQKAWRSTRQWLFYSRATSCFVATERARRSPSPTRER